MYERILSLDQSYSKTGFAVIDVKQSKMIECGLLDLKDIKDDKSKDERTENIIEFIKRAIEYYNIDLVIFEDIQKQVNVKVYKELAWLQGVIKHYLHMNKIEYAVLNPKVWKSCFNIKGRKRVDQKMNTRIAIERITGTMYSEDIADAIAIGLAGVQKLHSNELEIINIFF